ncbi:MAG TPA: Ada metal-binding domain-containing protein, partial [Anaeromyxobacteraceae bacterium]|nr:Ada metal-binding domain-containing protein [Anaeromyxobacteraceae bacterium]
MRLDPDVCYRALVARDRRFDGRFLVAVATTGVYCRPVCTARTPGRARCTFFATAAEAERAGFRACLVCRPELAPGEAPLDKVPRLVARALARIEAGALDEGSLDALAASLGVTGRHLRRAVEAELGVPPVAIAQTHRLARAKRLLHDSALPLAEVALASGFRSVRRFNAAFRERFGRAPSALRRNGAAAAAAGAGLRIRLDFRPPYGWE